jgi:hypothetical protein
MAKLSDRELNAKLMESLNITSSDAKKAFEDLMKEKVEQIRKEVRQEVFEEFAKQAKVDKENIVESVNTVMNKVVADNQKKNEILKKNLIKEKLSLKEAKDNLEKEKMDYAASVKADYNKKLMAYQNEMNKKLTEAKADYISKATKFLNETLKNEVSELRGDRKQLGEALTKFGKFISDQVAVYAKEHKHEMDSLDNLRVRLVKEHNEKLSETKKKFFTEAAEKMEKFTNAVIARELKEFRSDIVESRKRQFGAKLFEAFAKEYAVKFFNEDKVVKSMLESVKANQNKLIATNKTLEKQLKESKEQNAKATKINEGLMRNKIINESVSILAKDKQDMIKNLVKDVPTEKLQESINKYIPMIMNDSGKKQINNNRVLKEGRKPTILTGEKQKNRNAMSFDNNEVLDKDLEREIERTIAISKI